MSPTALSIALTLAVSQPGPAPSFDAEGQVTLPLAHWSTLVEEATRAVVPPKPPSGVAFITRSVDGSFRKGLLEATLTARFRVYDDRGYLRVPVIDSGASPGDVQLNGRPTSLVEHEGMYTIGVAHPGDYEVRVDFFRGHEQDRFNRRLQLRLPEGGVTAVAIDLPEAEIDAKLAGGTVVSQVSDGGVTKVRGYLDARGDLDLTWATRRHAAADAASNAKLEAEVHTLAVLQEGLVRGLTVLDIQVKEGEADRVALRVPEGVEIMRVTGEAVLQWRSDPDDRSNLDVLLRYLVDDRTRIWVEYQYAASHDAEVPIRVILPPADTPVSGTLGVQAPPGLGVAVAAAEGATALALRELPSSLTELTNKPLIHGFRFMAAPDVRLRVARHAQVELTSTVIDELQASSVVLEDGQEITKLRLDIRNNSRQYLALALPEGAVLTHALLDGQPVRPARSDTDAKTLPFSLRQSEQIAAGEARTHTVRPGETLGQIAHRYYGDPERYRLILDNNIGDVANANAIRVGQALVIPAAGPVTVEESAFVLEIAYRVGERPALSGVGEAELALPSLDVDAMRVTWHVYLPDGLVPLSFDANLRQLTQIRYGLFDRVERLLSRTFADPAHAGGDNYESILQQRKGIYQREVQRRTLAVVAPTSFPLVGQRYRFKRILADDAPPRVRVTYVSEGLADGLRVLAFAALLALTVVAFGRRPRWWKWLLFAVGLAGLMTLAHYILGVHRGLAWAFAAGLLVALWRRGAFRVPDPVRRALREPWTLPRLLRLRTVAVALVVLYGVRMALGMPSLLPVFVAAALTIWWVWLRTRRATTTEVAHG